MSLRGGDKRDVSAASVEAWSEALQLRTEAGESNAPALQVHIAVHVADQLLRRLACTHQKFVAPGRFLFRKACALDQGNGEALHRPLRNHRSSQLLGALREGDFPPPGKVPPPARSPS